MQRLKVGSSTPKIELALSECYELASTSTDLSTQVGACVCLDRGGWYDKWSWGKNQFPDGISEFPHRMQAPDKYYFVDHAETNAVRSILNRETFSNQHLIATWACCAECAKDILASNITTVIADYRCFEFFRKVSPDPSKWENSVHAALDMFEERGIEFYTVIPDLERFNLEKIRIAGQLFQP